MTNSEPESPNKLLQYSSLGFQMLAFMAIFGYLGYKGDDYFDFESPYLLMVGLLFGVIGATIYIIRSINKLNP